MKNIPKKYYNALEREIGKLIWKPLKELDKVDLNIVNGIIIPDLPYCEYSDFFQAYVKKALNDEESYKLKKKFPDYKSDERLRNIIERNGESFFLFSLYFGGILTENGGKRNGFVKDMFRGNLVQLSDPKSNIRNCYGYLSRHPKFSKLTNEQIIKLWETPDFIHID